MIPQYPDMDRIDSISAELAQRFAVLYDKIATLTDENERLRTQLEMWQDGNIMSESHHDEIKRLTAERDEARRWICEQKASISDKEAKWWAEVHTWDCYKEKR